MTNTNKLPLNINKREIHLWLCEAEKITEPVVLDHYQQLLTDEEHNKQKRYRFEKHQHQYLVTRAVIRTLLSLYYPDTPPEDWRFDQNQWGKPSLVPEQNPESLSFNLSHTDGLICCAFSKEDICGADVEDITRDGETIKIANRYFSPKEYQNLMALPENKQQDRFFDLWTLKESYIKACGMGLAISLSDFGFNFPLDKAEKESKSGIGIEFVESREDNPDNWRFWSYCYGDKHRIALSLHSPQGFKKGSSKETAVEVKSFRYIPLLSQSPVKANEQFKEQFT